MTALGMKDDKKLHISLFLHLLMTAEMQLVSDEKLTANDEEQNNAHQHVSKVLIQADTVRHGNFLGTKLHEHQQE